jgi:hypothetical protein
MGGYPRRRSASAWIIIAKPAPILLTGGQRNVSRQTGNSLPPLTQWRPVPNVR